MSNDSTSSKTIPSALSLPDLPGEGLVWFYNPGEAPSPGDPRERVFAAVVCHLGYYSLGYRLNAKRIHDYMTFLLRGWNPITAWIRHRCVQPNGIEDAEPLFESHAHPLYKRLLDFESPICSSDKYHLLAYLSRLCRVIIDKTDDTDVMERFTLTTLATWLLTRKPPDPECLDPVSIRACMDLYYRDVMFHPSTPGNEYLFYSGLSYAGWLMKGLNRLAGSGITSELMTDRFIYLAWFMSLVRAGRMYRSVATKSDNDLNQADESLDFAKVLPILMSRHVAKLRKLLDDLPNRLFEESDESNKFSRFLNVFGIKPRPKKVIEK